MSIDKMVDRFLAWKLPEDFAPDCGISFDADAAKKLNPRNARYEPVGTNLLTATQAKAMLEHVIGECEWGPDDASEGYENGVITTQCGITLAFDEDPRDASPSFCCRCGGRIVWDPLSSEDTAR